METDQLVEIKELDIEKQRNAHQWIETNAPDFVQAAHNELVDTVTALAVNVTKLHKNHEDILEKLREFIGKLEPDEDTV